jgi:hypothetical protein
VASFAESLPDSAAILTEQGADWVGGLIVFNVGGNKHRLIAAIHFNRARVYIRYVLTHGEYDQGAWKVLEYLMEEHGLEPEDLPEPRLCARFWPGRRSWSCTLARSEHSPNALGSRRQSSSDGRLF